MGTFLITTEFILTGLLFIALLVLIYNLHAPRVRFLVALTFMNSIFALGHCLELLAGEDIGQLFQSYILTYMTMPFLGLFFMLFAYEYRGRRSMPAFPVIVCMVTSTCLSLIAITASKGRIVDRADIFTTLQADPIHFILVIWSYILLITGDIILAKYVAKMQDKAAYKSVLVVLAIVCMPAVGLFLDVSQIYPGYDFVPMISTLANILMIWFILFYRTPEWSAVGRHNAVENMHDAFFLINNNQQLLDLNKKAIECFPILSKDMLGMNVKDIPNFPLYLLDTGVYDFTLDVPPNGVRHFMLIRSPLKTEEGKKVGTNILLVDDTINYDITEVLRHQSQHDHLTGLFNRGALFEIAGRDWLLSVRNQRNGCILMFDIDFFKKINDTYGHLTGDVVLKSISETLKRRVRNTDICARYGGEEFVVWLPDTPLRNAFHLAEELRLLIEKKENFDIEKNLVKATVSIGVVDLLTSFIAAKTFERMLVMADAAMYHSKNNGRNRTTMCVADDNGKSMFLTNLEQLDFLEPMLKNRKLPNLAALINTNNTDELEKLIEKL